MADGLPDCRLYGYQDAEIQEIIVIFSYLRIYIKETCHGYHITFMIIRNCNIICLNGRHLIFKVHQ